MINTRLLLKYKVSLTEAVTSFNYCYICIKNYKGITVEDITAKEARQIIKQNNLNKEKIDNYPYEYGTIYTDGKFQNYMKQHPGVKKGLYKIIDKLEEN